MKALETNTENLLTSNKVSVINDKNLLHAKIGGFFRMNEFVNQASNLLKLIEEKKLKKLFLNLQDLIVLTQESQAYFQSDWTSKIISIGVKDVVFVMPDNIFGKISVNISSRNLSKSNINVYQFEHLDQAEKFLRTI